VLCRQATAGLAGNNGMDVVSNSGSGMVGMSTSVRSQEWSSCKFGEMVECEDCEERQR
jgi:hypothetical protein